VLQAVGRTPIGKEIAADAVDIGKTIQPHPTLGESIGIAAARHLCQSNPKPKARTTLRARCCINL
jgi:hypothetical protein